MLLQQAELPAAAPLLALAALPQQELERLARAVQLQLVQGLRAVEVQESAPMTAEQVASRRQGQQPLAVAERRVQPVQRELVLEWEPVPQVLEREAQPRAWLQWAEPPAAAVSLQLLSAA